MTTQEAYDRIREFFLRPEAELARSGESSFATCYYRKGEVADSPVRCAVGCLIPDEHYSRSFEGVSVSALDYDFGEVNIDFLEHAQDAHDRAASVEEFLSALSSVAHRFGLEVAA